MFDEGGLMSAFSKIICQQCLSKRNIFERSFYKMYHDHHMYTLQPSRIQTPTAHFVSVALEPSLERFLLIKLKEPYRSKSWSSSAQLDNVVQRLGYQWRTIALVMMRHSQRKEKVVLESGNRSNAGSQVWSTTKVWVVQLTFWYGRRKSSVASLLFHVQCIASLSSVQCWRKRTRDSYQISRMSL